MFGQRGLVIDGVIADVVDEQHNFRGSRHSGGGCRGSSVTRNPNASQAGPYNQGVKLERRSLLAGAEGARGIVIVIDVLRAFSCSALMFHYGIRDLTLVGTPEEALARRGRDPACLVAGEVKGVKVEGFDIGNSPADIVAKGEAFFRGRRVVARSSAGTQGVLAAAQHADEVLLGSYMTAAATAAYVRSRAPARVTIVAMGYEGVRSSIEDERCADYLEHLIGGNTPYDHVQAIWDCLHDPDIAASLRGEHHYRPKEDIVLAFQRDVFAFAMACERADGSVRAVRCDVTRV